MSRRGEITIECDTPNCHAEIVFAPADFYDDLDVIASADGWKIRDGRDVCPDCSKPENPREKGEDDGREYGHPGDHLKGID